MNLEELHPADTSHGVFCEHSGNQDFEEGRNGAWKVKFFAIENFNEICDGVRLEGTHSKNHFEENNPQRPNISFIGVDLPFEHFWSHING